MKRALLLLMILLLSGSAFLAFRLYTFHCEDVAHREAFEALRQIVIAPEETESTLEEALPDIAALRQQNPDCIGWLRIPGTTIDYPVMQSAASPEYYLKHDFEGNDSLHGVPFADSRCSLASSDNIIIYGHQKHDGTMFSPLLNYEGGDFYSQHRDVELFLADRKETYRVFAVLRTAGTAEQGKWSIYNSLDLSPSGFTELLSHCREQSLISSECEPVYGDRLLTLVTCEYSQDNGRLAVIAYKEEKMNKSQLELELGYCLENPDEFSGEVPEETLSRDLETEEIEVMMKWQRK